ncbi:hypothetical protein [Bradyrhizobium sp. AUGA SZCCT0160]|uniref:hypothetical protein n=1 Tax=Bradyrhizobium sp. AUGA SZCCT0160 TaxID=2807662 RepID=UPI001BA66706|nr:hypothetical protein [Bradyrhizobium sp. AUGA SZCCT0160]MBR1193215.1 hypothetical protein [Bradyrhizobium sp. AUGA SZCCT0160]
MDFIELAAVTRNAIEFLMMSRVTAATAPNVFGADAVTTAWLPGGGSAATVICRAWTRTVAEVEMRASAAARLGAEHSAADAFSPDAIQAGGI